MMARFFVSPESIKDGRAVIEGPDVRHITRVLRLGPGDRVILLDGRGSAYDGVIESTGPGVVVCSVCGCEPAHGESPLRLTLVQGLPKAQKMDLIVQKGTELGISTLIPVYCRRSVVQLTPLKAGERQRRWQRIAVEAAKQCRRAIVPVVWVPITWEEAVTLVPEGALGLLPWEEEETVGLRDILSRREAPGEVYIFIGPEGGLTREEVEVARARGIITVGLGPRILRTETAGLAVAAVVQFHWGDFGGRGSG